MINLIPTEEKRKMSRNFYFRLVILFLTMLGFSVLAASAALLPSYFLSSVKENFANAKFEMIQKESLPEVDRKTMQTIQDLDSKLSLIENAEQNKFLVSEQVIGEVVSNKMPDIKITRFSYENSSDKGKKISLRGVAPDRERLLFFRRALEKSSAFSKVDLPISNFIKGSNIEFSLSLIPS